MHGSSPRHRQIVARLALVAAGLLLGFLGIEAVLRLGFDPYRCREEVGWTFAPGRHLWKVSTHREFSHPLAFNSAGFRDRERSVAKAPDTFRVLLLGDSMIAGIHVPESEGIAAVLERELARRAAKGRTIEVVNAGIDGYGQAQQLRLFRGELWRLEPDLVLAGIYLGNDLADNWLHAGSYNHYLARRCGRPYTELRDGTLVDLDGGAPLRPGGDPLFRLSAFYANFVARPKREPHPLGFDQWDVFEPVAKPGVEAAWTLLRRLLVELRREVESRGVPLVYVLTPDKESVGQPPGFPTPRPLDSFDHAGAWSRLRSLLEEDGHRYVDLAPRLREQIRSTGERPYYRINTHWNAVGNAIAGEEMAAWLASRCWDVGLPAEGCGIGLSSH